MNRIIKCVKFQFTHFKSSAIMFFGIYIGFFIAMMIFFWTLSNNFHKISMNTNFYFAGLAFTFIYFTVTYKPFFNNLMIFCNTRKTIINSFYIFSLCISLIFSLFSLLGDYINVSLAKILSADSFNLLEAIYSIKTSWMDKIIWYFTLFMMVSSISLIYGSLSYKFGKNFKLIFWLLLALIMMFNTCIFNIDYIRLFFGIGQKFGILKASLNMFVLAAIIDTVNYFIIRRQPQSV